MVYLHMDNSPSIKWENTLDPDFIHGYYTVHACGDFQEKVLEGKLLITIATCDNQN